MVLVPDTRKEEVIACSEWWSDQECDSTTKCEAWLQERAPARVLAFPAKWVAEISNLNFAAIKQMDRKSLAMLT